MSTVSRTTGSAGAGNGGGDLPYLLLRVAARPMESLETLAAPTTVAVLDRRLGLDRKIETEAEELKEALFQAAGPPDPDAGSEAAEARLAVVALKRDVHNRRRLGPELFTTATPRLGTELLDRLTTFDGRLESSKALERVFESAFLEELRTAREALRETVQKPGFQAALRLASRSLLADARRLPPPDRWRHDERHVAATLAAYLIRATTKTSPHGLFCATAPAGWAAREEQQPPHRGAAAPGRGQPGADGLHRLRLEVLLHVVEARKIAACLGSGAEIWPALVPRVNPTLTVEGADDGDSSDPGEDGEDGEKGAWILWRPASLAREDDHEIRRRIVRHPVAELFVEKARAEQLTATELIAAVAEASDLPAGELASFFAQLSEAGLLSREISIPYTCRRPLAYLAATLRGAGVMPDWLHEIDDIESGVDRLSELAPEPRIEAMDRLTERLDALPHTRPLEKDELFRADAASGLSVTLPPLVLSDLQATLSRWSRLFAAIHPRPVLRRSLARRFVDRHGADREVPFLDVYRSYDGASKAAPGKDPRLFFPPPPKGDGELERSARSSFEKARNLFFQRAVEAERRGDQEVELRDEDWEDLVAETPEPPWTAGALFQIAARGPRELSRGRYRLALNDLFTGFGVALARFAHLHHGVRPGFEDFRAPQDNPVVRELERAAERFRRPGAVLAEITYNHWGRAANAGLRIPFLEHEIELVGERATPGTTAIPLTELTLRWDSGEERLVLRWTREDVEVVPVVSSGVSPEGVVALLVGIGRQTLQPLSYFPGFDPPEPQDVPVMRWPRFVHGRVVLFRRRWVFSPGALPEPAGEGLDPDDLLGRFFAEVHVWRRREGLPRHLFVRTERRAKPFAVDLESPLSVDLLRRLLAPGDDEPASPLHVSEMLPGPDDLWVRDPSGTYAAELLVQMGGGPRPQ